MGFRKGSRSEKIVKELEKKPGQFQHQIAKTLGVTSDKIGSNVCNLKATGDIVQKKGKYYVEDNQA